MKSIVHFCAAAATAMLLSVAPAHAHHSFPATYQIDARITRVFKFSERYRLTLLGEGFNILNRSNVSAVNNNFYTATFNNATQTGTLTRTLLNGAPAFDQPRLFLTERQFQLGIKFEF